MLQSVQQCVSLQRSALRAAGKRRCAVGRRQGQRRGALHFRRQLAAHQLQIADQRAGNGQQHGEQYGGRPLQKPLGGHGKRPFGNLRQGLQGEDLPLWQLVRAQHILGKRCAAHGRRPAYPWHSGRHRRHNAATVVKSCVQPSHRHTHHRHKRQRFHLAGEQSGRFRSGQHEQHHAQPQRKFGVAVVLKL